MTLARLALQAFVCICVLAAGNLGVASADAVSEATALLERGQFSGGFIVHVGATDGELTTALQQNDATQVQGLVQTARQLKQARDHATDAERYGNVSFDQLRDRRLPYVDNLVNLLIVEDDIDIDASEIDRVLVPGGVALIRDDNGWTKNVKAWPDNIDQWSHYLHDPSGNSVAHDDVVGPPRHLQWVGSPRWSRHHDRMASMSALVSTGGRMFYIMDEGSRISIQMPPKWKLIARDAFNGTVLWKRDIDEWQSHLWPLKSGPSQLSRRLVSTDDVVYAPLGFNEPLSALDAKTGKTLRVYEGTDATEEIICTGDTLYLVVRKGEAELQNYTPLFGTVGDQARSREEFFWDEQPRVLMAFDADSGKQLWAKQTVISPLSLAAQDSQIYFHDGQRVVSLDGRSGDTVWASNPVTRRQSFTFNFGPRLVVYQDVVLYAGGDGKLVSVDAKSGEALWDSQFPNSGYQSPQDLMVVDGLVWLAPLTSGKDSGVYTGRDPRTGEVKKEFAPDVDTYWFHHRCYIAKATDNFLMPSRTGIEFVDPDQEHWDIHHWVRGGCLYGVMPCNGLTYAPPHNCACYPEAKLFGFNALSAASPTRPTPGEVSDEGRLEQGPAFGTALTSADNTQRDDWPTYRHDARRSGTTDLPIDDDVQTSWSVDLGGRLTSPVIADETVYVAQVDTHTLFAMDETTGDTRWTFKAGGRIDSPPTVHRGRVVFGSTDGWVYCLTTNGELVWRFRAAPIDRRTMAFEQLESLWPVHGSVLIHNDQLYCVAGRSIFLDGGLRLLKLDLATGQKLAEKIMDEKNPDTGNNIQEKLQILQMPVGLPDILSCDGDHIFMKSQKFDLDGNRLEIGPNSGDFVGQVSKQRGPDAHIFAPMGFLDDTWFHRSYWVHGQSFAGGHGGYYQAGRFAPSGRIMVNGNGYVYGYGRKPEYLRWTTVLEHQLFAAEPNPPKIPENLGKPSGPNGPTVSVPMSPSIQPQQQPITVEAWFTTTKPNGVIVAHGGPSEGYALSVRNGRPEFLIRSNNKLNQVSADKRAVGGWHHVVGVLDTDRSMKIYLDGRLAGEGVANGLISKKPAQGLDIGSDQQTAVGEYTSPGTFTGIIDEVRIYFAAATSQQIAERYSNGSEISGDAVLAYSFDDGSARDHSLHRNSGTVMGAKSVDGQFGRAVQFTPSRKKNKNASRQGNSLVEPKWTQDVPVYVRGMVLAGENLFIIGPPDIIDEQKTFEGLSNDDPKTHALLNRQDKALLGAEGAALLAINIDTGEVKREIQLDSLPTWDGMAGANGSLFLTTLNGEVICFSKP
ncbi:PQQ-binding-like beta-propeller repeat protein [Crateriforma spongiae]|uniref:outer membrane protein assembly factor BamB family protein n=1 Tax=Crateriforma spongiae TaxID=2724528 RepID=UPI0039AEC097